MKAILPVAGYATRFGEVAECVPKQLLPVLGKPILDYTLDKIDRIGEIDKIYLITNDRFYRHFANHTAIRIGKPIEVLNDGSKSNEDRRGTIRDIGLVLERSKISDDVMIVFPDNLFDFNLEDALRKFRRRYSEYAFLVAYDVGDFEKAKKFGVLSTGPDDRVMSFTEKPDNPTSTLCSTGIYFLPKTSLKRFSKYLSKGENNTDAMGYFIEWFIHEENVFAYTYNSSEWTWLDIGTPESYKEANSIWVDKFTI
ncbi:nucleotidyltransferase family protein [Candidatus Woesearchaeota archaeon]|nr:nucleotidyltransferase family protein [Candidatus Woesearchaeota archaeon]